MKKVFPILIILFIMALGLQVLINVFVAEHNVKYSIKTKKDSFFVNEKFIAKDSNYDFTITDKENNIYNFFYRNGFNKQDRIIRDIKVYEDGSLKCIVPLYKRNLYDNIYCTDNNVVYTYYYLRQINNTSMNNIIEKIKNDGYYKDSFDTSDKIHKEFSNNYYVGNMMPNYKVIMWNYTGLDIIDNKKADRRTLLENEDIYDNDYSTVVGKYYIILNKKEVNDIMIYDIDNYGRGTVTSEDNLSGNYNVLGVYKNKLYLFDIATSNEYSIDPYGEKVEKVGDKDTSYKGFDDNKLIDVDVSTFKANINNYKQIKPISINSIEKKYGKSEIYSVDNYYYFRTADNSFYRATSKYKTSPVKLFKLDSVSTWKIVDRDILIISDNMLYVYNDNYGLKPIILNNEFRYRYKNMVDIWHK